jgi:hypothetical protein
MSRGEVRVIVLFEDKAHRSFMMRLVDRLALTPVRYVPCRDSTGVLRSLGEEVNALRAKNYQRNLGLVAVIDADEKGLQGRTRELLERITSDTRGGARAEAERVALVVPAREIEAWYVHLCCPDARPVDELRDDYKNTPEWRELEKDLGAAAKRAVAAWDPEAGRQDPASVTAARAELARVT